MTREARGEPIWDIAANAGTVPPMTRTRCLRLIWVLGLTVTFQPGRAAGYAVAIHEALTRSGLPDTAGVLQPSSVVVPTARDLAAFRAWLWQQASAHPDEALRTRFLARYPTAEALGPMALRELLGFTGSPRRRIFGIDRVPAQRTMGARAAVVAGAAAPDLDGRNRDRLAFDPARTGDAGAARRARTASELALRDKRGQPMPFDPATLNMGRLEGLSSQAHAHYGLLPGEMSSDPNVLESTPERFAIAAGFPAAPVITLAPEMAQLHADLGVLAALWGGRGSRWLTISAVGQGLHYVQDLGNQIHTVQVGSYALFRDAKIQYWWRAAVTAGGYLTELRSFVSIGMDILRNHHIFIEQIAAQRFLQALAGHSGSPAMDGLAGSLTADDPDFAKAMDATVRTRENGVGPVEAVARALIVASSTEGGEAYRLARQVSCGRLRAYGVTIPDDTEGKLDADTLVCGRDDPKVAAALEELYALQARGMRRAVTAMRRVDAEIGQTLARADRAPLLSETLGRLLRGALDRLDAAESRRAQWAADPPILASGTPVRSLGWLIAELLLALLLYGAFRWLRRKALVAPLAPSLALPEPPTRPAESDGPTDGPFRPPTPEEGGSGSEPRA